MGILFETLGNSILGISIVFLVLILLMVCIKVMTAIMGSNTKKSEAPAAVPTPVAAGNTGLAKGSCGTVKTFDVPDKTAAMLMAITADMLGEPLNTLRFISIQEVK